MVSWEVRNAGEAKQMKGKIKWLEKGLKEILDCCDLKNTFILSSDDAAFAGDVKDIAQSSLDGEPTTADEYNEKSTEDEVFEYEENMNSKEKKVFGGDTGIDADYFYEHDDQRHDENNEIQKFDRITQSGKTGIHPLEFHKEKKK